MNRRDLLKTIGLFCGSYIAGGCQLRKDTRSTDSSSSSNLNSSIRLNLNENPYGLSPQARHAAEKSLSDATRYPSPYYQDLILRISRKKSLPPSQVVIGVGSTDILRMATMIVELSNKTILTSYPTYEAVHRYAAKTGRQTIRVPLGDDFLPDLQLIKKKMNDHVGMVYICHPNNPTGNFLPSDRLVSFVEEISRSAIVLVDEAYYEYVDHPDYDDLLEMVREGHNIIITRTFSKIYGMAGLRVGYALANVELAEQLRKFQTFNSISIPGIKAAIASIEDQRFPLINKRKNKKARDYLYKVLSDLNLKFIPSQTNFVFFDTDQDIRIFAAKMRRKGILVGRPFPPYLKWCRVSIGTMSDMKAFGKVLKDAISH